MELHRWNFLNLKLFLLLSSTGFSFLYSHIVFSDGVRYWERAGLYFPDPYSYCENLVDNISKYELRDVSSSIINPGEPPTYDCEVNFASNGLYAGNIGGSMGIPAGYTIASLPEKDKSSCPVGNPIDPVTGAKYQVEKIGFIGGLYPISIDLYYDSSRSEKWRHTYDRTLTFSASPAGQRIAINGYGFGGNPIVDPESPTHFGDVNNDYGIRYTASDATAYNNYASPENACINGWNDRKVYFHYPWVGASVAELRQVPTSSFGSISQCHVLDEPEGTVMLIFDLYNAMSGNAESYDSAPVDSYLRFTRHNGDVIVFSNNGGLTNISGTGETLDVIEEDGDVLYRLKTRNDEIEDYSGEGRLLSITSAQGYVQLLKYNSETGLLEQIANDTGERLDIYYEEYDGINRFGELDVYSRIVNVKDHSDRVWSFNYDPDPGEHTLSSIEMPGGELRQYHYKKIDNVWLLSGITDENNNRYVTWDYDNKRRAILSAHGTDLLKDRTEVLYHSGGVRTVTNVRTSLLGEEVVDRLSAYFTHAGGERSLVARISGHDPISFEHDAMTGNLKYREENGRRTEYDNYDSKGNPGTIREAVNSAVQREKFYIYDARYHSKVASISEQSVFASGDKVTSFQYDDFGNNTSISIAGFKPDGTSVSRATTFQYNGPYHQLTQIDGPRTDVSDITTIQYYPDDVVEGNNRARMKNVFAPEAITLYSNITYTATGKMLSYIDENGVLVTFDYFYGNDRLKSLHQLDPSTGEERLTQWTYLATGEVETITTGSDVSDQTTLTFNYDDARRLIGIVDGLSNRIEYILDSQGNIEQENTYDASNNLKKQLTQTFDDYDRLELRTQVNESRTETWSPDGTLEKVIDGNNVTTDYSYDNLRRLTQINQDMGGASPQTADALTILNYDVQDNLTSVQNPVNGETIYSYDDLGNQLSRNSDDTGLTTYQYDDAGNITSMLDANDETISYSYDALNRLTSVTTSHPDDDYQMAYDDCENGAGRLCRVSNASSSQFYRYDAFGNIIAHQSLQYSYDTADRLQTLSYPSGALVTYSYDAAGQVESVSLDRNGSVIPLASNISYQPFGDIENLQYGNGLTLTQSRDAAYRSVSQIISNVFELQYNQYDANGNLKQRTDDISGVTTDYAYDEHDRLVSADGEFGVYSYQYDKNANRTDTTQDGASISSSYEPGSNRLSMRGVDNAVLDDNGNMTSLGDRGYSYTRNNRLFEVYDSGVLKATYQYNGLGQRISKTLEDGPDAGKGKYFLYDTDGKLMAETDLNGNILFEYIYLNGQLLAKYSPDSDNDGTSNHIEDQQGTNPTELDSDNDGLSDIEELFSYGTQINNSDSDNDGINDSTEIVFNSNPLNSYSNTGDINLDGEFNVGDYVLLMQFAIGTRIPTPTEQQQADLNQDGEINAQDALKMQRALLGEQLSSLIDNLETLLAVFDSDIIPVAHAAVGDGDIYYIHNDHLGTPQKMTDEIANVVWQASYDPFGKAIVNEDVDGDGTDVEMNVRFPGQYYDGESGLHYNYFRTYDPELGRYLTSDPIGLAGGVNTFGYVGGNPTMFVDPKGEIGVPGAVVGGVIGGVSAVAGSLAKGGNITDAIISGAIGTAIGAGLGAYGNVGAITSMVLGAVSNTIGQSVTNRLDDNKCNDDQINFGSVAGSAIGGGISSILTRGMIGTYGKIAAGEITFQIETATSGVGHKLWEFSQ